MTRVELLAHMASRYFAESMILVQDTQVQNLWSEADCLGAAETLLDIIEAKHGPVGDKTSPTLFRNPDWRCEHCGLVVPGGEYHDCKESTLTKRVELLEAELVANHDAVVQERERIIQALLRVSCDINGNCHSRAHLERITAPKEKP